MREVPQSLGAAHYYSRPRLSSMRRPIHSSTSLSIQQTRLAESLTCAGNAPFAMSAYSVLRARLVISWTRPSRTICFVVISLLLRVSSLQHVEASLPVCTVFGIGTQGLKTWTRKKPKLFVLSREVIQPWSSARGIREFQYTGAHYRWAAKQPAQKATINIQTDDTETTSNAATGSPRASPIARSRCDSGCKRDNSLVAPAAAYGRESAFEIGAAFAFGKRIIPCAVHMPNSPWSADY
jgi:hypothetical protein